MSQRDSRDWLEQMLVDEATQGLSKVQSSELDRLVQEHDTQDRETYQRTAAALEVAFLGELGDKPGQPEVSVFSGIPESLDLRLDDLAAQAATASDAGRMLEFPSRPEAVTAALTSDEDDPSVFRWLLAAALLVALIGWWPRLTNQRTRTAPELPQISQTGTEEIVAPDVPPGSSVSSLPDALRLALSATEDPAAAGAGGEVTWSNQDQSGSMQIAGLEVNDPAVFQYQLWIFDSEQDEKHPIDGGVFDIRDAQATIQIDAKIRVADPTLFAITVEKPGGVVVSGRERIVLVAPVA